MPTVAFFITLLIIPFLCLAEEPAKGIIFQAKNSTNSTAGGGGGSGGTKGAYTTCIAIAAINNNYLNLGAACTLNNIQSTYWGSYFHCDGLVCNHGYSPTDSTAPYLYCDTTNNTLEYNGCESWSEAPCISINPINNMFVQTSSVACTIGGIYQSYWTYYYHCPGLQCASGYMPTDIQAPYLYCDTSNNTFEYQGCQPISSPPTCNVMGAINNAYYAPTTCTANNLIPTYWSSYYHCPGLQCAMGWQPNDYQAPYLYCDTTNNTWEYNGCTAVSGYSSSCTQTQTNPGGYTLPSGGCTGSNIVSDYGSYYYCTGLTCASGYSGSPYLYCDGYSYNYYGCSVNSNYSSSCTMMGVMQAGYITTSGACTINQLTTTSWSSYFNCPGLQCANGFTPSDSGAPYLWCDWTNGTYEYYGCSPSALSSCTMMGVINAGYLTTQGACTISNLQTTVWTSIGYYHCPGLQCASGFTPSDSEAPYIYCDWSNGTYEYNGCDASYSYSCSTMGVINAGYVATAGACTISGLVSTVWSGYYNCPGLQCANGYTPVDYDAPYIWCDWYNGTYEYYGCDTAASLTCATVEPTPPGYATTTGPCTAGNLLSTSWYGWFTCTGLQCAAGYMPMESGAPYLYCAGGDYMYRYTECEEIRCFLPYYLPAGYRFTQNYQYNCNATASECTDYVECDYGYVGFPQLTCAGPGYYFSFSGCVENLYKCTLPTGLKSMGYDLSSSKCSGSLVTSACTGIKCAAGYTGQPYINCDTDGSTFTVYGCYPSQYCTIPDPMPMGYQAQAMTRCNQSTMWQDWYTCPGLSCAVGFTSMDCTAPYAFCPSNNTDFQLYGCEENVCVFPSEFPMGYANPWRHFCNGTATDCGSWVACDEGFLGSPYVICPYTYGTFLFLGCQENQNHCSLPSTLPAGVSKVNASCNGTLMIRRCQGLTCQSSNPKYYGVPWKTCGMDGGVFNITGCYTTAPCTFSGTPSGYTGDSCTVSAIQNTEWENWFTCPGLTCDTGYHSIDSSGPYVYCDPYSYYYSSYYWNSYFQYWGCEANPPASCAAISKDMTGYMVQNGGHCSPSNLQTTAWEGWYHCPGLVCASGYTATDSYAPYLYCDSWNDTYVYSGCESPTSSGCNIMGPINAGYVTTSGSCTISKLQSTQWTYYYTCPGLQCASGYTPSDYTAPYLYCDTYNATFEYDGCIPPYSSSCNLMGPMNAGYVNTNGSCTVANLQVSSWSDYYFYCPGLVCANGYTASTDYSPYLYCDTWNNTFEYYGCDASYSSSCNVMGPMNAAYKTINGTCTVANLVPSNYSSYYFYCPGLMCASGYAPSYSDAPYLYCDTWNNTFEFYGCDETTPPSCTVIGASNAGYVLPSGGCSVSNIQATYWTDYYQCPGLMCAAGYSPSDSLAPYLYCDTYNNTFEYYGCDSSGCNIMGAINSGYVAPSGGCSISSLVATSWSSYYYNCPGLTCAAGYSPIYSDGPYLYCDTWNMTYEYYGCESTGCNIMGAINSDYVAPSGGCSISSLVQTYWSSYYYNCPGLTCAAGYSPIYSDGPYLYCDTSNNTYEYYGCEFTYTGTCNTIGPINSGYVAPAGGCTVANLQTTSWSYYYTCPGLACAAGYSPSDSSAPYMYCDTYNGTYEYYGCDSSGCNVLGAINSGYVAPSGGCPISSLVATDWSSYYYNCPGLTCAAGYSPIYSDAPYLYCDTWNMTYEYYGCESSGCTVMGPINGGYVTPAAGCTISNLQTTSWSYYYECPGLTCASGYIPVDSSAPYLYCDTWNNTYEYYGCDASACSDVDIMPAGYIAPQGGCTVNNLVATSWYGWYNCPSLMCDTGYTPSDSQAPYLYCDSYLGLYEYYGCDPSSYACSLPVDMPAGYAKLIDCYGTASSCDYAVYCHPGYQGAASVLCSMDGGEFTLSGCLENANNCTLPSPLPNGTMVINGTLCNNTKVSVCIDGGLDCASDYFGPIALQCTINKGQFNVSGCVRGNHCQLPPAPLPPQYNLTSLNTKYSICNMSNVMHWDNNMNFYRCGNLTCGSGFHPFDMAMGHHGPYLYCPMDNGTFTFFGCVPNQCYTPYVMPTGYAVESWPFLCEDTVETCTPFIGCAMGYMGQPMLSCPQDGQQFQYTGCVENPNLCSLPKNYATNASYTQFDFTSVSCSGSVKVTQCKGIQCASGYFGEAWLDCLNGTSTFMMTGCELANKCSMPEPFPAGYIVTSGFSCGSSSLVPYDFNIYTCPGLACSASYHPDICGAPYIRCDEDGGEFQLTDCIENTCSLPSSLPTGYTWYWGYWYNSCEGTEADCAGYVGCDYGYIGQVMLHCVHQNGTFRVSGCYANEYKCKLPTASVAGSAYDLSNAVCAGLQSADSCYGVVCARTYLGSPVLDCPYENGTFTISGCSEGPSCYIPSNVVVPSGYTYFSTYCTSAWISWYYDAYSTCLGLSCNYDLGYVGYAMLQCMGSAGNVTAYTFTGCTAPGQPNAYLVANSPLSNCAWLYLDASSSTTFLYGYYRYFATNLKGIKVGALSSLNKYLATQDTSYNYISIAPSYIPVGTWMFTVNVTDDTVSNALACATCFASVTVTKNNGSVIQPTITVLGSITPVFGRSDTVILSTDVNIDTCGSSVEMGSISFQWSLLDVKPTWTGKYIPDLSNEPTATTSTLSIDPYTLTANTTYCFKLATWSATSLVSYQWVNATIQSQPLYAYISTYYVSTGQYGTLQVAADGCFDPDDNPDSPTLHNYKWSICKYSGSVACVPQDTLQPWAAAENNTVDYWTFMIVGSQASPIPQGYYRFTVYYSRLSDPTNFVTDYALVTITRDTPPLVIIYPDFPTLDSGLTSTRYISDFPFYCNSEVYDGEGYLVTYGATYNWTLSSSILPASVLKDSSHWPYGFQSSVFQVDAGVLKNDFSVRLEVSFTDSLTGNPASGYSETQITVNLPPKPGNLSIVNITSGKVLTAIVSGSANVRLQATGWISSSTNLNYVFSYVNNLDGSGSTLSSAATITSSSLVISPPFVSEDTVVTFWVTVMDRYGGSTSLSLDVTVKSVPITDNLLSQQAAQVLLAIQSGDPDTGLKALDMQLQTLLAADSQGNANSTMMDQALQNGATLSLKQINNSAVLTPVQKQRMTGFVGQIGSNLGNSLGGNGTSVSAVSPQDLSKMVGAVVPKVGQPVAITDAQKMVGAISSLIGAITLFTRRSASDATSAASTLQMTNYITQLGTGLLQNALAGVPQCTLSGAGKTCWRPPLSASGCTSSGCNCASQSLCNAAGGTSSNPTCSWQGGMCKYASTSCGGPDLQFCAMKLSTSTVTSDLPFLVHASGSDVTANVTIPRQWIQSLQQAGQATVDLQVTQYVNSPYAWRQATFPVLSIAFKQSGTTTSLNLTNITSVMTFTIPAVDVVTSNAIGCFYWDWSMNSGTGGWSTTGVTFQSATSTSITCTSKHLSDFTAYYVTGISSTTYIPTPITWGTSTSSNSLPIGLGIGLGIGIPVMIAIIVVAIILSRRNPSSDGMQKGLPPPAPINQPRSV
jgi:hypothetical protein